ncbi:TonB-dependent receptor [Ideonella sp.]|uniref:TonB-dependent receptor n=1 Tax=Ideonella sp. TaxID=1929293 RepID=UPI002B48687F|nr:TonB-dependent receptor [Ideonella sp.]HJV67534.1 TonB-dependent receptor [Ideonella sp.]
MAKIQHRTEAGQVAAAAIRCTARWALAVAAVLLPCQPAGAADNDEGTRAAGAAPTPAPASETPPADTAGTPLQLERIVVTGTAGRLSKLRSSLSVSTLDAERLQQLGADSASDILRSVPGILAQSSGGEGNANITARGLPLSGGAKLMLFEEDGLPVLSFGDIDFATIDTFVRADATLDRVEVIRGGSAATFVSNAPGGIFNFISKTGEAPGGSIALTSGVDFDRQRVDLDYGRPLDDQWRFHIGGFYRQGEGPRTVGYRAEDGGQIKGNLTRSFDRGFVRVSFKLLEDRAPVYLPVPVAITGTTADPHVASLPGFDVLHGAMQSRYFLDDLSVGRDGQVLHTDMRDGYYSRSRALGLEGEHELAPGWSVEGKLRVAATSGRFVGPYPAQVDTASALATAIGGAGATLRYANGPLAGQAMTDPATLNGNGLAVRTHLFNTTLNDLGNYTHDLKLTRSFEGQGQSGSVTVGYFKSRQEIDQDWHWNTYLQEVRGQDSALLDVVDARGNVVTQGGLVAYGEPFWGNCCVRSYRLRYDTDAPYLAVHWQKGPADLDASLRYDIARGSGSYAGASGTRALDVNGDGALQVPEQSVPVVDPATRMPVDSTVRYLSYSVGGNYLLTPDLALFARASKGGRHNAERVLFGGGIRADGSIAKEIAVNTVTQYEGGVKWRRGNASVFATLFHATTQVTDQDITSTTERFSSREYEADGLELEGAWDTGDFSLRGGLTYTRGKIAADQITPLRVGEQINPKFMAQLAPSYRWGRARLGLNIIGLTAFPSTRGGLANPGFVQVNAFAGYAFDKQWTLSITGNNLFDRVGITEIPNASGGVTANGVNTARSVDGRTILATLAYAM